MVGGVVWGCDSFLDGIIGIENCRVDAAHLIPLEIVHLIAFYLHTFLKKHVRSEDECARIPKKLV